MKSLVAMSYYQLMHAIAVALTLEDKPILYMICDYLYIDTAFLEKIESTKIFSGVVALNEKGDLDPFIHDIRKTKNLSSKEINKIGNSIFEKYLEPYYAQKFADSDFDDEIYVYNDFQWPFYYIAKHFNNIIGVEDGYRSLGQQTKIHEFKNNHALKIPFAGKFYPEPLFRNVKVKKVISSSDFEHLDDYLKDKMVVLDYYDIIRKNEKAFEQAILQIFQLDNYSIKSGSGLVIGQSLQRNQYCNALQEVLLHRKMVSVLQKECEMVYLKPHPADKVDQRILKQKNVIILEQSFPIDTLNYSKNRFCKSISFGSTSLEMLTCVDKKEKIFNNLNAKQADVKHFIRDYTKDQRIKLDIYVKVENLSCDVFLQLYSLIIRHNHIDIRIRVVSEKWNKEQLGLFFSAEHLSSKISEYNNSRIGYEDKILWQKEIKNLILFKNGLPSNSSIEYLNVESLDSNHLFNHYIRRDESCDYFLILEENNWGFRLMRTIITEMETHMPIGLFFENYTTVDNSKISLGFGKVNNGYTNNISNCVLNKRIMEDIPTSITWEELSLALLPYKENVRKRFNLELFKKPDCYSNISDGHEFYLKLLNGLDSKMPEDITVSLVILICNEFSNWMRVCLLKHDNEQAQRLINASILPREMLAKALSLYISDLTNENDIKIKGVSGVNRELHRYLQESVVDVMKNFNVKNIIHSFSIAIQLLKRFKKR